MRVIAGSARRIRLATVAGMDTRPTTDRIKETLFNMMQGCLAQGSFLDCFAGSGAIGIEALSRGAAQAVFIERNPEAAECIRQNLAATRLEDRALVMRCDVLEGLGRLEKAGRCFDVIFMDPPYGRLLEKQVIGYLADSRLVHEETKVIAEASLETDFSYAKDAGFEVVRSKEYKTNKHVFLQKAGASGRGGDGAVCL